MKNLDVLSPHLNLNQRFFVEASAGCGKTFAIENVFVRLLIQEDNPLLIEEILVLTFTKEATKELKKRLKASIEKAIQELCDTNYLERPFLIKIVEDSMEKKERAISLLKEALNHFDQAQIFTLHGFCYRMLTRFFFQSELLGQKKDQGEVLSLEPAALATKDFLLYKLKPCILLPSQVELLIQSFRSDFNQLFTACIYELAKEKMSFQTSSLEDEIQGLQKIVKGYKPSWILNLKDRIVELFSFYKGIQTRSGELKPEITESLNRFIDLWKHEPFEEALDAFIPYAKTFFSSFEEKNLKKKGVSNELIDHLLLQDLKHLKQQVEPLYLSDDLFSRLISHLQPFYLSALKNQDILTPNQILLRFQALLKDEEVSLALSKLYGAAIVDEFQDTDEVQWDILNQIFLQHHSTKRPFFLVGDPKQSIYAFRDADIYTYLKASKALGSSALHTLKTNYRSQPELIEGLNTLFNKGHSKWMQLPQLNSSLHYSPVLAYDKAKKKEYGDTKASIHWLIYEESPKVRQVPSSNYEENYLFPFVIQEIIKLVQSKQATYSDIAVLVRDRYQKERLKNAFDQFHVPFQSSRPERLEGSSSVLFFYDLLNATLYCHEIRKVRRLALNPFLKSIKELDKEFEIELTQKLSHLRDTLVEKGFLFFFEDLLRLNLNTITLAENLLSKTEGLEVYQDWGELVSFAASLQSEGKSLFEILDDFYKMAKGGSLYEEGPLKMTPPVKDAVHLLTLHMSKGLEFDLVFPIGLINQTPQKERLIPLLGDELRRVVSRSHCLENTKMHERETAAEKLRQLYVAMTRAKQRLYLPVVFSKEVSPAHESPMTLFLNQVDLNDKEALLGLNSKLFTSTLLSYPHRVSSPSSTVSIKLKAPEEKKLKLDFPKCHSFSSLSQTKPKKELILDAPKDFEASHKTVHTLPAGAKTGTLYHHILETIDFQNENFSLHDTIQNTPYETWEDILTQHVQLILKTPLPLKDGFLALNQLQPNQIMREVEFLYPYKEGPFIEDCVQKGDFLNGFIDLIFIHNNYVYFLDYKTNWLGYDAISYRDIHSAFIEHQYDLQAMIYKKAIMKYLDLFRNKRPELIFGGGIYWFIRGVESNQKNGGGVLLI